MDPEGHIQATGIDAAGRKQYIYHPRWHEASAVHKYGRLKTFAAVLPSIRRRVQADLKASDMTKPRIVAAVVRLLDKACLRIGNKQYLEANDSRGATTLTSEHVVRNSHELSFKFVGKSGQELDLTCKDQALAAVIEDCENSEGEFLFSYQNAQDEFVPVTSSDVNRYLLAIAKESVTAKDFRTWRGSVLALQQLASMEQNLSKTARKRFIANRVKVVAAALGNTPAVCRQSYIHSAILSSAEEESLAEVLRHMNEKPVRSTGLTKNEVKLLLFLAHVEQLHDSKSRKREQTRSIAA